MRKIKKGVLIAFILLFSLLIAQNIKAEFYNISYHCENDECVRGNYIEWYIAIENKGSRKIELIGIELKEGINNSLIAGYNVSYYPLNSYRGDLFVIRPGQKRTLLMNTSLPKANNQSNLIYYPCFDNAVQDSRIVIGNVYNLKYCYEDRLEVIPMIECASNLNCKDNEFCTRNECKVFECKECEYISDHLCMAYECCDSNSCRFNQVCENNICLDLDCKENEYFLDHDCVELDCLPDEGFFNNSCTKLDCNEKQQVLHHSCVDLNCSKDEYILDHSCVKLDCKENEYLFEHSCVKLDCKYNEAYYNHTCLQLSCSFYQKIINHQCNNDKPLITKLSIELIVVLIIIFLIVLDIRKIELRKKK